MLVGESSRRCGADRKWSGTLPTCKGKQILNTFMEIFKKEKIFKMYKY